MLVDRLRGDGVNASAAESRLGFENLKQLLNVSGKEDLEDELNAAVAADALKFARFRLSAIKRLINFDNLNSRP